jgi:beta-propeller repeat-containing protein
MNARNALIAISLLLLTSLVGFACPVAAADARVSEAYGRLPLHFEANRGQTHEDVRFLSRGAGYSLYLTAGEAVLVLAQPNPKAKRDERMQAQGAPVMVRMSLEGSTSKPLVSGLEELPGKANYFIGSDSAQWRTNVPTYAKVHYQNVYRGIDLIYYGNQRQLEYDFVVAPGADPKKIVLGFKGADKIEIDAQGGLVLHTAGGALRQHKPVIYQEIEGVRTQIEGGYVLKGAKRVGFQLAAYDRSRPLVIDPVLAYSTYLGGNFEDYAQGIAVDASGSAYVVGHTGGYAGGEPKNNNFPTTPEAFQSTPSGGQYDVYVTKLDPSGSALVYSTYLGRGQAGGITVDSSGSAYVTGNSGSSFPTTPGAYQPTGSGVFVTKLDRTGSVLVYSTFVGNGNSWGTGIAVDADRNAYVTGIAYPVYAAGAYYPDFPTTPGAFQPTIGNSVNGGGDAFVTKLNPAGSALVYSTYLGGNDEEVGRGIAVDADGNAYITGVTKSGNFPTTEGAFQPSFDNEGACFQSYRGWLPCHDVFVTKLDPTGSALIYSTYLGGSLSDISFGIAVDATGNAYVTGYTTSNNFPTTAGALQPVCGGGGQDAFVTKFDPTGTVVYSTHLGGRSRDAASGIAVDAAGNAYVTGTTSTYVLGDGTSSSDFPTTEGAFQPTSTGGPFVTKLDPTGSKLLYSTYFGGEGSGISAIAVDASGSVYVTGSSTSRGGIPITVGSYQSTRDRGLASWEDAFVAKIAFATTRTEENAATHTGPWTTYGSETGTFSDGTVVGSNVAESTAVFSFTGTAVSWIGVKCQDCGIATVSIDGGPATTVNTAGPGWAGSLISERLFSASGLAPGVSHTIAITATGTTTSYWGGAHIGVDAIDVPTR